MDRPYSPQVFEIIESIITTLASKAEQPPHEKKISPLECVEDGQSYKGSHVSKDKVATH